MPDRSFMMRWPRSCRILKRKSSNVPIPPKASSSCQNAGSSNALSHGSTVAAGWPKTGKNAISRLSLSSAWPPSASCSENFAILYELSGRTLRTMVSYLSESLLKNTIGRQGKMALDTQQRLLQLLASNNGKEIEPLHLNLYTVAPFHCI